MKKKTLLILFSVILQSSILKYLRHGCNNLESMIYAYLQGFEWLASITEFSFSSSLRIAYALQH